MSDPTGEAHKAAAIDLTFELAAVLSEFVLNVQAIGQAASERNGPALQSALVEAIALRAECHGALMKFHAWVEASP